MIGKEQRIKLYQHFSCPCATYIVFTIVKFDVANKRGQARVDRVEEDYCDDHVKEKRNETYRTVREYLSRNLL